MRNSVRLLAAVAMGLGTYWLALRTVPSVPPVRAFIAGRAWVSRGDITQVVLLATSVLLMYALGGGPTEAYGFRGVRIHGVVRPMLVSLIAGLAVMGPAMLWATAGGAGNEGPTGQAPSGGPLKMIVSVWLLASVSEEVFFRGLLMGFLAPLSAWRARLLGAQVSIPVAVCALLFALGHLPLLPLFGTRLTVSIVISAVVLGLIAGYYRERTGSLVPAVATHVTFNIVGAIVAGALAAVRMKI